jgi:pyroglutamyl-peptidase
VPSVLLTGFEPFDGASSNPSWDAVARVTGVPDLVTARLPVEFGRAWSVLNELIERHSPEVVIAVGLAADRVAITPERIAINLADARIPDNAGDQPREERIVTDGPDAHFTGLPVTAIVEALRAEGVAADVSLSAGAFVCNDLMYRLLDDLHSTPKRSGITAGFIHVPSAETMPIETTARGLELAVSVTLDHRQVTLDHR